MPLFLDVVTLMQDTSHSRRLVPHLVSEYVTKVVRRERGEEEEEVWQHDRNTDRGIRADEG